jgi:hypothetical protein
MVFSTLPPGGLILWRTFGGIGSQDAKFLLQRNFRSTQSQRTLRTNESVGKVSLRKIISSVRCSLLLYLFRLLVAIGEPLHWVLDSYRFLFIYRYPLPVLHANPGPYRCTLRRLCTMQ